MPSPATAKRPRRFNSAPLPSRPPPSRAISSPLSAAFQLAPDHANFARRWFRQPGLLRKSVTYYVTLFGARYFI